jgi:hypothetical protein
VIARILVALAIALLCAMPATGCAIDETEASCLVDDAIATDDPAPTPGAPRAGARANASRTRPAADPGRGRVFRPPRA